MVHAYPRLAHKVMHAAGERLPYQFVPPLQLESVATGTDDIGCGAAEISHPDGEARKVVQSLAAAHLQLSSWPEVIEYAWPRLSHAARHAAMVCTPIQLV